MIVNVMDIETTGLDADKYQVIEFACIVWDTQSDDYLKYETIIHWDNYYIEPVAAQMNAKILERCYAREGVHGEIFGSKFNNWHHLNLTMPVGKLICCGKNFASFDRQFLQRIPNFPRMHHRVIDPMMFWVQPSDEVPPNLEECCKRAGIAFSNAKHHTAMYDCELTLELLKKGWQNVGAK